jgi:regulation of enolase protein 1 (concanavalin A-like superfamily)
MRWLNEPASWRARGGVIEVVSAARTDFWRETHYGFVRDTGHFYADAVDGDFVATVKVSGAFQALYDQAGLMVRRDASHWLKCGVEYVHGVQQLSAVVTREFSDWSVVPMPHNPPSVWIRVTRRGTAVEVHHSADGEHYTLLRLAYLTPARALEVGIMCASPDGDGFRTTFEHLEVRALGSTPGS